jgi:hypothetical protein
MAARSASAFPRVLADDGTELHLLPVSPQALPRVDKRDLEQAWDAARDAARVGQEGSSRGFRFANGETFSLHDRDARAWAGAVDAIADLSTPHGVSLCIRLLALIDLIGRARWLAPFVRLAGASGACLSGGLLQAAAITRLTPEAGLDEAELRRLLPRIQTSGTQTQETPRCSA